MEFLIADTFTDSLARLTGDEQKAVKTSAFDLQMAPSRPGLRFHRVDRARDRNFWSVRVSSDIRIIVHRTHKSLLLCYVDHHDDAYRWAQRRRLVTHPRTGAAQLVEIRETVKEIEVPVYVQAEKPKLLLFADITDDDLLNYGVPAEWLPDVRLADDDSLLDLADHLPVEAAEALLELATGGRPQISTLSDRGATREVPVEFGIGGRPRIGDRSERDARRKDSLGLMTGGRARSGRRSKRDAKRKVPSGSLTGKWLPHNRATSREIDPFDHPDARRRFRVIHDVEELERALDYP